ncbi:2-hydroxyacid dehydrogenase [Paraburkholderia sediminicola]|uniref:2-hydroxyacid dehydrogenase n=1 Tax=Paraburkholderia sediminicola TaxID=458836 RepID=UPI0038B8FED1
MTTIALMSRRFSLAPLKPFIEARLPGILVLDWQDDSAREAEVVVCWDPPEGVWNDYPNVRLIHSIGAGVNFIVSDPSLPKVPVCRIVNPDLVRQMVEYVTWSVLYFYRRFDLAMQGKRETRWTRVDSIAPGQYKVGVMGLGALGMQVATHLVSSGFEVRGWARSEKILPGVAQYYGPDRLMAFCDGLDVLICLLPLTDATRGILCETTFSALSAGGALVHCGRGEHLVEPDLVYALRSGKLRGAVVDVFEAEPLPGDSPLWAEPNLVITPHMAAVASFELIAQQIAHNAAQLDAGGSLANTVDVSAGY